MFTSVSPDTADNGGQPSVVGSGGSSSGAGIGPTIRAICIFLLAIAVAATAVAAFAWRGGEHNRDALLGLPASFMLIGVIVLIGTLLLIQVTRALGALRRQSTTVKNAAIEAEKHYKTVLQRIIRFVEAREKDTRGRSERIGKLSHLIGRQLDLPAETCEHLQQAGRLHDIGLLAIPEAVLNKRGHMGGADFRTIQRHAEVSYEVLKPLESLAPVLPAIRYHHERMNGTGYPFGLKGEQIPTEARILAVADAYDAMTHDRPHRRAMSPLEAMKELLRCTPAGYDKTCVDALARIVNLDELLAAMEPAPAGELVFAVA